MGKQFLKTEAGDDIPIAVIVERGEQATVEIREANEQAGYKEGDRILVHKDNMYKQ